MEDLWGDEKPSAKKAAYMLGPNANMTGAKRITKKVGNMGTLEGFDDVAAKAFMPREEFTPRKRPALRSVKNHKAAVALPHGGQSYNPEDAAHQDAMLRAARNLERKQVEHAKFVAAMTRTEGDVVRSAAALLGERAPSDEETEEERAINSSHDAVPLGEKPSGRVEASKSAQLKEKQRRKEAAIARGKKKLTKVEAAQLARRSRVFQRQPKQDPNLERIEEVADEVAAKAYRSHQMAKFRKQLKRKDETTLAFGRHHHQPVAMEVAPTAALTGSLRTVLNTGTASHCALNPLVDRVKSLEARNMIPARMRHTYNKKREVLQPGEVRVHREPFGTLPNRDLSN
jgi:hypothetical protein